MRELRSEQILIEALLEYGFGKIIARRLIRNHGENIVRNAIQAVDLQIQRNHARNPKAMLQTAI